MSAAAIDEVAARVSRWLAQENGTDLLQQVLQVLGKTGEELAELMECLDGRGLDYTAAAGECADIVITARTAQLTLGFPGAAILAPRRVPGDDLPHAERMLALNVARLGALVIGWTMQNPRKRERGLSVPVERIVDQLDEVIVSALKLLAIVGGEDNHAGGGVGEWALRDTVRKVHARFDEMGVAR